MGFFSLFEVQSKAHSFYIVKSWEREKRSNCTDQLSESNTRRFRRIVCNHYCKCSLCTTARKEQKGVPSLKGVFLYALGSPVYFTCKGFTANAQPGGISLTRMSLPYCSGNFIFLFSVVVIVVAVALTIMNSLTLNSASSAYFTYTCTYIFVHVSTSVHVYTCN